MRTFKVDCSVEGWTGFVVMKHIPYDAKWDYLEEFGDISKLEGKDQIKAIRSMVKLSEQYYVEVALVHADGSKVSSFEEMKHVPEFHNWIMNLGMRVFNGNVGNG